MLYCLAFACAVTGPPPRPRLICDAATLEALRAAPLQAVVDRAAELAAAETYHYAVRIPAPNGEHDGWEWSYTLSPEPPPRHDESRHYPPWTAMFQERSDSITTRLKHFVVAWRLTGEAVYLDRAREIIAALCAWPQWTDPSYGSLPSCLDTGHCTQTVAMYYDWCHDAMSADERAAVRAALVSKGIEPIRESFARLDPYHNFWAVINTGYGLAALALLGEVPEAETWLAEAIEHTAAQFDSQGADGGSFEGPMYGTYAADQLAWLILSLDRAGVPHRLHDHPFLASLPRFAGCGLSPHVRGIPTFGDGGWTAGYRNTMAILAAAGDEAARWYLERAGLLGGDDLNSLLLLGPLRGREPAAPPAWLGSAAFVDIGYAFVHNGDSAEPFLAFRAGPPERAVGHNHFDQNSFQLTWGGTVLAGDPGYRSYFDPAVRRYTVGSLGHNTIVLDPDDDYLASEQVSTPGRDQVRLNGGRLTALVGDGGIGYVEGEAAAAYNPDDRTVLERFTRRIVYLPPHGYLVRDTLVAPEPHRFGWLLHGPAGSWIEADDQAVIQAGGAQLVARLFAPGGVTWSAGDYPGAEAYGPYALATTTAARELTLTALLVPRASDELVVNGGFEAGLAGWQIRQAEDQAPNHSASEAEPHAGRRCGRIERAGYFYSNRFTLPAGSRLVARAMHRTEGAERGGEMILYFWADGRAFANERVAAPPSEAWREVVLEATVPPGTEQISVALQHFDAGAGYWDDCRVESDAAQPNAAPATVEQLDDGFRLAVDGLEHEVSFGGDAAMLAYTRAADGRLLRLLAEDCRHAVVDGREVLTAAERCTVSLVREGDGWRVAVWRETQPHAERVDAAAVGLRVTAVAR